MKKIIEDFMNSFDGDFTEQSLPRSHQKHPFLMTSWGVPDEEVLAGTGFVFVSEIASCA